MRRNRSTRSSVWQWALGAVLFLLFVSLPLTADEATVLGAESSPAATVRVAQGSDGNWNQAPRGGSGGDTQWGPGWDRGPGWGGRGWGHFGPMAMSPWASPWVWILGVLLLAVLVVGIVLLFRGSGKGSRGGDSSGGSPSGSSDKKGWEEILKERYARGEISREEYREMIDELNDRSS